MKKTISLVVICLLVIGFYPKKVILEDKYIKEGKIEEINKEKYKQITNNKESFLLFVYEPLCTISNDFEDVLNDYIKDYDIYIYKLKFSELKKIDNTIKYYPSLVIFQNGKIKKYLDANKKADLKYFKSKTNVNKWINKYTTR